MPWLHDHPASSHTHPDRDKLGEQVLDDPNVGALVHYLDPLGPGPGQLSGQEFGNLNTPFTVSKCGT